jgi:lysophospholipase L1-like esterase
MSHRTRLVTRCGAGVLVGVTLLLLTTACSDHDPGDSVVTTAKTPSPSTVTTDASAPADRPVKLVTIGDSIPDTISQDCPGCVGFVDRYAKALGLATGREVESENFSDHTSKTLPTLLDQLPLFEEELRSADVIIVGIAHNSILLNADAPCGTSWDDAASGFEDWTKITTACAARWTEEYRPQYDDLFATIAAWRKGRPTVLRTINKYSDWIGWDAAHLTGDEARRTILVHDSWNKMLCASAERNGFTCADIYHAFNGPHGDRASGDLLAADYTHPSDKGNALIARLLIAQGFAPLT